MTGIYKIQSKIKPNKIYIGSAVNIKTRWTNHIYELKRNNHKSPKLQAHFNKYGKNDLQFSILLGCEKENLLIHEQWFIDSLNPWFNTCKIAGSCLGKKCSNETKKKIGKVQLGRVHTLEHRLKNSIANKGRCLTEIHKKRISESLKGNKQSDVMKAKISKLHKGKIPWNKGKLFSKEEKIKYNILHPKHRFPVNENNPNSKLNKQKIEEIFNLKLMGLSHYKIAKYMGVSRPTITAVINGVTWKNINAI